MLRKEEEFPHNSSERRYLIPILLFIKIVFLSGVLLFTIAFLYYFHTLTRLSFSQTIPPVVISSRTSKPASIQIDRISLNLPIRETLIVNNTWEIADDGISHLAISGRPEEGNTTILYGHNTNDRFGPLLWLAINDSIRIITLDNTIYSYTVVDIQEVDPSQTDILTSHKDETLILYTCAGFADLKRHVVIAKRNLD